MTRSSPNQRLGYYFGPDHTFQRGPLGFDPWGQSDAFGNITVATPGPLGISDHAEPEAIATKAATQSKPTKGPRERAFDKAVTLGWLPYFEEAASQFGQEVKGAEFGVEILLAIGYRETGLNPKYLKEAGDNGHGYGLMQADIRSFKEWIAAGNWHQARACVLKGAEVLRDKIQQTVDAQGRSRSVVSSKSGKSYPFVGKKISGADLLRVGIAAYNGGLWPYYCYSNGEDVDQYTTGKNYSADVLKNSLVFLNFYQHSPASKHRAKASQVRQGDFGFSINRHLA